MDLQPERASTSISLSSYLRLVRRNRNFRRLWLAQIVSELGDWFYTLAIYSLLLQLTGRASSVALALVLQVLPQTFIGPAAGVINDRISRKRVMIAADLARMVIVFAMLLVRSRSTVWLVYPLLLLETLMAAFFEPARTSVIPNVAAREDVLVANTLSSATWSVNLLVGASVGGVVAALFGRDAVFVLNALSFLVSAMLIRGMRFEEPHAQGAAPLRLRDAIDLSPVIDGIRYVRRDRRLLAAVCAKAGELMIGPSWVLFTVMGNGYFQVHVRGINPQRTAMLGMSLLLGARGIGAVVGPLFSARWAGQSGRRLQLGILLGYLTIGIGYFGLGRSPNIWVACGFIVLAHCGGSTVWVFSTTILQLNTEDRFRGRVFSADLGFSMLTIAIGAYVCGIFLDRGVSAQVVASATGIIMLLPALLWGWAMKSDRGTTWGQPRSAVRLNGVQLSVCRWMFPMSHLCRASLGLDSRGRLSPRGLFRELVDLGRHDEVALGQAIDLVCPQSDLRFAPGQQDVGMMPLLFRDLSHPVHEVERLLEIREGKRAGDVMLVHHRPLRHLLLDALQFHSLHGRHASAAGNAVLAGKIFWHEWFS